MKFLKDIFTESLEDGKYSSKKTVGNYTVDEPLPTMKVDTIGSPKQVTRRSADDLVDYGGGKEAVIELNKRLDLIYKGRPKNLGVDKDFANVVKKFQRFCQVSSGA